MTHSPLFDRYHLMDLPVTLDHEWAIVLDSHYRRTMRRTAAREH
jgi:hypothetical protein